MSRREFVRCIHDAARQFVQQVDLLMSLLSRRQPDEATAACCSYFCSQCCAELFSGSPQSLDDNVLSFSYSLFVFL